MKKRVFIVLTILSTLPFYAQAADNQAYTFIGKEDNISLYQRWVISENNQKVRELKAFFYIQSDFQSIEQVLKNQSLGKQWNTHASIYKIDKTGMHNEWLNYIRYDLPWPLNDQDCYLQYTSKVMDNHTIEIRFQSIKNSQHPILKGVGRISGVKGKWVLKKVRNNKLKVVYTITSDPSFTIPRWLSDPIVHKNLIATLSNFRSEVEGFVSRGLIRANGSGKKPALQKAAKHPADCNLIGYL